MNDQEKVRALLPHWIEHNDEHAAEFRRWAEKVRAAGQEEVAEEIALAAKELGWVSEALSAALQKLGGPANHAHPHDH
jgi:translation initiation factor IF-2